MIIFLIPFMVFFATHCGVTNAAYYLVDLPSAFLPPLRGQDWNTPCIYYLPPESYVTLPHIPHFGVDTKPPPIHEKVMHMVVVPFGNYEDGVRPTATVLYFSASSEQRSWFVSAFPAPFYDIKPHIVRNHLQLPSPNGSRVQPSSCYYVFYGCPICGEYNCKYGLISLAGRATTSLDKLHL
jgi:hypothetical protein